MSRLKEDLNFRDSDSFVVIPQHYPVKVTYSVGLVFGTLFVKCVLCKCLHFPLKQPLYLVVIKYIALNARKSS